MGDASPAIGTKGRKLSRPRQRFSKVRGDAMRTGKTLVSNWLFATVFFVLSGWLMTAPTLAKAQNCSQGGTSLATCQGWNGVYLSGSSKSPSYAFVDAFPYLTDSRCASGSCDICDAIYYALTDYNTANSNGVVIDARGIATPQNCTNVTGSRFANPWSVISARASYANIVLLPTGSIYLAKSWVLPTDTRIIGEGASLTTILPCTTTVCGSGQALSGDLIDMGSSSICPGSSDCQAVVIEHLGLNGSNVSGVNGIVNSASQELSRVDDVSLVNIAGTGLSIDSGNTSNSGPYSNIYYSGSGICASISGPHGTRGIHGLTCNMSGSETTPAVYIDSSNNSFEDISLSGNSSQDGILVGFNAAASNNVLFNVRGSGLENVIHISAANSSSDITVLGVTRSSGTNSIEDDLTSPHTQIADPNVAMYIVGEPVQAAGSTVGYSRFSTSPSVPTWLVGPNSPGTGGSCAIGSLYSATSGSSGTLFGCRGSSGVGSWHNIN